MSQLPQVIAPSGIMDRELTRELVGYGVWGTGNSARISILYFIESKLGVQTYLATTALLGLLVAVGVGGRWTVIVAWLAGLGIAHRVPMLQGPGELLALGMIGYLAVDPGKLRHSFKIGLHDHTSRYSAGFAVRMAQVHFVLWMVLTLASCLAEEIWWNGNAAWSLAAADRSVWWTKEYLVDHPFLVNAITHVYLLLMIALLISLTTRGYRTWGIVLGLGFAALTYGLCGDWLYAAAILTGISAFAGESIYELRDDGSEAAETGTLLTEASNRHDLNSTRNKDPNAKRTKFGQRSGTVSRG
jgi:hypothetical protein